MKHIKCLRLNTILIESNIVGHFLDENVYKTKSQM